MNSERHSLGNVGVYFNIPNAAALEAVPVEQAVFQVTKIAKLLDEGQVQDVRIPALNAYFLMIYMRDAYHCDIKKDGVRTPVKPYLQGSICLVDLVDGAAVELHSDLHALAFVLPKGLFLEVAQISSFTRLSKLICKRSHADEVLSNLGIAFVPLFEASRSILPALLKPLALAICAHLLHDYSDKFMHNGVGVSSLSIRQEKAAKEYMIENLGRELSVAEVASVAGLSPNHFTQEFRKATGTTPYQWLMKMRVDRAKDLLPSPTLSLKDIADECGFTDQSHFTKVFARETGSTPAVWRTANCQ
ncbi:helix-turn-helix transcriptional regulator [Rhizobium sp. P40RR-XXII]|uniref:helix-turn-helix domain-containing protein n=1 Tax=unclassified Rhizobium TaxID=2613769 RepID=UPI00145660A4|nr:MULTISPECIES: AraC family transcriptional regulator [unclassified Rhizobium]NLR85986.1 helix-turn-helix transcriptional regulator [Rhizobium sp. P28RR-XV]NLS18860.1 helix-turn-helix transcriptional regulator [Rhizobium sp. P40RR-XXII]